jgi:DNA-binding response OmpR family regulator
MPFRRRQRKRVYQPPRPQQNGTATAPRREVPRPSGPPVRRKTVLVVEDHATVGGLMVALLREAGYRALRAWDVREALRVARDRKPELILLDLSLPYADGVPLLDELQRHPETSEPPIILLSGNQIKLGPGQRELLRELIVKPIDIDKLENAIRRALGDPEVEVPPKDYSSSVDSNLHAW